MSSCRPVNPVLGIRELEIRPVRRRAGTRPGQAWCHRIDIQGPILRSRHPTPSPARRAANRRARRRSAPPVQNGSGPPPPRRRTRTDRSRNAPVFANRRPPGRPCFFNLFRQPDFLKNSSGLCCRHSAERPNNWHGVPFRCGKAAPWRGGHKSLQFEEIPIGRVAAASAGKGCSERRPHGLLRRLRLLATTMREPTSPAAAVIASPAGACRSSG